MDIQFFIQKLNIAMPKKLRRGPFSVSKNFQLIFMTSLLEFSFKKRKVVWILVGKNFRFLRMFVLAFDPAICRFGMNSFYLMSYWDTKNNIFAKLGPLTAKLAEKNEKIKERKNLFLPVTFINKHIFISK